MSTIEVLLYTKQECGLCDEAKAVLHQVMAGVPDARLREVDIASDPALMERFAMEIPVVFINGKKRFKYRVEAARLAAWLAEEANSP